MIVDLHVHPRRFVPQPFRAAWKGATPLRPRDSGFDALRAAGIDAVVATAVGDPIVTRCYRHRSPWQAVELQLAAIEQQAVEGGAAVVRSVAALERAHDAGTPAVMLGVEGADAVGGDVDNIDRWHQRGVRMIVLVHLGDNDLGTTCMPWQQYTGPVPVRRPSAPGLTPFGALVVTRMNELGLLVDVAHCDRATCLAVIDRSTAPVVSSHSGARAVQDFARYLSDEELRAVAATGGVVGLWPYRSVRHGVRSIDALVTHAQHIASLVGPEHLAVGTDANGVPRVMAGYRGVRDLQMVSAALASAGFTTAEVDGIMGGNARRVLAAVETSAR